jgi:electron transport complex protein RnfD
MKRPPSISDFSAIVTGMLVAFNVPPTLPWWMVALGAVFAIAVAKMAFGGLGHNFINPALAGRAFLMANYPAEMTSFIPPCGFVRGTIHGLDTALDGITAATPLSMVRQAIDNGMFQPLDFQDAIPHLFWGNIGGCIGETSVAALLLGALLLWYKRIIGFAVPVAYAGTVFLLSWLFNGSGTWFSSDALIVPVYQILSGGLMLGALFMATDMVTSPISPLGRLCFGVGCGVLTFLIRNYGGYPEGVSYSILIMNCVSPLLDRYLRPRTYGAVKSNE